MEFNLAEKLAIVKAIDEIILADGKITEGEIAYLGQLIKVLDLESKFVDEARKFNVRQAIGILKGMTMQKKHTLALMLHEMANADGEIDEEEKKVLIAVFIGAGINIGANNQTKPEFDVSDIYFESSNHIRYENGQHKSGPHEGAKRAIKVEPNIEGKDGYSVTTYNLESVHQVWGYNIQMSSKQMEIISSETNKTVLRGYGVDPSIIGDPAGEFLNYGISIFHPNNEIEKITLHMHDRNIDIEYLR